jgi:hypothetical protein
MVVQRHSFGPQWRHAVKQTVLASVLFIAAALAAFPAQAQPTMAPDVMARHWLLLVDSGNYKDSWTQAGQPFKSRVSEPDWQKAVAPVRAPLGPVKSRNVKDVKLVKSLSGVPDGQYAIVQFNSTFSSKETAVETLSMVMEKTHWAVIGYFIK